MNIRWILCSCILGVFFTSSSLRCFVVVALESDRDSCNSCSLQLWLIWARLTKMWWMDGWLDWLRRLPRFQLAPADDEWQFLPTFRCKNVIKQKSKSKKKKKKNKEEKLEAGQHFRLMTFWSDQASFDLWKVVF